MPTKMQKKENAKAQAEYDKMVEMHKRWQRLLRETTARRSKHDLSPTRFVKEAQPMSPNRQKKLADLFLDSVDEQKLKERATKSGMVEAQKVAEVEDHMQRQAQ